MENSNPTPSENQSPASVPTKTSPKNKLFWILGGGVLLLAVISGVYFIYTSPQTKKNPPELAKLPEVDKNTPTPTAVYASTFAAYQETPVNVTPQVPSYMISPDLSNVTGTVNFTFSDQAKKLLVKNAFVVQPGYFSKEFYPLYESNRYSYVPSFITTDSMLHNYHLMFDYILKKLEEEKLAAALKDLNTRMLAEAVRQYDSVKGTDWENAAKRNVGFFAVGSKLLDASTTIPAVVSNEVGQELALVEAHQTIAVSPVMNMGGPGGLESLNEDYSQYVPRGHYDKTPQLQAYFKSMMWYGRLTFRLKSDDEIKSGILITLALNKDNNHTSWDTLYEPINFFVGKSDDITYYQFKDAVGKIYSKDATVQSVTNDKNKFNSFISETKTMEPPQLNSIPIFNATIQPDRERETKGFRFMGQRFTIDAAVFQRLIDREVSGRMLPKGLDIPAAFGSTEALSILTKSGEAKYAGYSENMTKMKSYIAGLPAANWQQNLYWGWLNALRPLTEVKPAGYPTFMRNPAWVRKDLNTFLGSWTELKHDTILYAKQVYAEMGGGGPEVTDDRGYVEPNVEVYARLASLLKMTSQGLETRGLLTVKTKDNLEKMTTLALSLKTISEKELNNEKLTDADYELIRSYGGQLEHFWLEVNQDEPSFKTSTSQRDYLDENPAALVTDVATDPKNGQVLEEGTGDITDIYVVVPIDGQLRLARGGVYSYYEFSQPLADRLTDKKWRELLGTAQAPALPSWVSTFRAKTE